MAQMFMHVLLVIVLCWSLLAFDRAGLSAQTQTSNPPSSAQPQDPIPGDDKPVTLESNLVNVGFTVINPAGRLVTDLTKDELRLMENEAQQPIAFFGRNRELPMVIALATDFSGSQEFIWLEERAAAQKFFDEVFRPGQDYVAVASFRNSVHLHTGLISHRDRLDRVFKTLSRVDTGYAKQGTALYDAIYTVIDEVLDGKTAQRILRENHFAVRRALILLTDGRDTTSLRPATDAMARAHRAFVTIYAIGIGDRFRFSGVDRAALDAVCRETGARAYYPRDADELRWAFREIAEELTSQYIVGFYPADTAKDGSFRKIRLEIPGRKDLTVRYRTGYFAKTEDR
jgi:Ca-activated chloride channel family protein